MKCPICKHGSTHPGVASVTLERNGATLVIRNVPADICDTCGEVYHNEAVTAALLKQAEAAAQSGVEFDVRRYAEAA